MILSLANVFPLFYAPLFMSEYVYALYSTFTSEYVCAVLCYFCRANVFALFYWFFYERMCLHCFMLLFFSSECVFVVYYSFTSEYVCAVLCDFPRAALFALFHVTFTSRYVYAVFWHLIICLRCYYTFLLANMFSLFYVFLWECVRSSASNVFAFFIFTFYGLMRSYCWCCLSCVWLNQIGAAALSVKIDALQKQVSADSVDRALECVSQLAGRPVGLSDGTAIVAALESLADVSRSAGHVDYKRHEDTRLS